MKNQKKELMYSMLMMAMIKIEIFRWKKKTINFRIVRKRMSKMNKTLLRRNNNKKNSCNIKKRNQINNNSSKIFKLILTNINNFYLRVEIIIALNKIIWFQVNLLNFILIKKYIFIKK